MLRYFLEWVDIDCQYIYIEILFYSIKKTIYKYIKIRKKITDIRSAYSFKERRENRSGSSYFLIQQRVNNNAILFHI